MSVYHCNFTLDLLVPRRFTIARIQCMYALLTKREVKMAGCRTETKSKSIKTQEKKKCGQMITLKNFAFAGTKRAIPSGYDRPILPVKIAN